VLRPLHPQRHHEPRQPPEVQRREHGAGHLDDGVLGLLLGGAGEGGAEHDHRDDEGQRRRRLLAELGELRRERVADQRAAAEGGDEAVGLDPLGREQRRQLLHRRGQNDQQQHHQPEPREPLRLVPVRIGADGPLLRLVVEPEQEEKPGQHHGAEGEAVAQGPFHGGRRLYAPGGVAANPAARPNARRDAFCDFTRRRPRA
jgi:hypothetical protein